MSRAYDLAIIGAGFSGGIIARELSRAGARVLVLERGPWRDTAPVRALGLADPAATAPLPQGWRGLRYLLRAVHGTGLPAGGWNLNRRGLFELNHFAGLRVLCSAGVGGGSHVYAGLLTPPADPGYWQRRHPRLDGREIAEHYPRVLADLDAKPWSAGHHRHGVWSALAALEPSGFLPSREQPQLGVQLPATAALAHAGRTPTEFRGDSFFGSPSGAKATADMVYLAPALAAGAELRPLTAVRCLSREADGYRIEGVDAVAGRAVSARARRVVVSAGTVNSLRLLFRAQHDRSSGVQAMPALGRCAGGNTDLVGLWRRAGENYLEAPASLGRFEYQGQRDPYFVLGSLAGIDALPLPGWLRRRLAEQLLVIAMAPDSGRSDYHWSRGRLGLNYDLAAEPARAEVRRVFKALGQVSGSPVLTARAAVTVHPWGGARVGVDPQTAVVDHQGQVFGNPGLFVADGSVLPAAPGAPPTLCIAAWAYHVARQLMDGA